MAPDRRGQLDALLEVELVLPRDKAPPADDDTLRMDPVPGRPEIAPREGPLVRGERLGKFLLERELGAGAMGVVWLARDVELDRAVALKILSSSLFGDTSARVRMSREARAMARLRHPNVITVFDAMTLDDRDVIAMELIDGETMAAWLTRRHTPREIIDAIVAAGRGLAAAHAAGVVHRDFKPHNVLIARDGRVVVSDFGLARAIGEAPAPRPQVALDTRSLSALDSPLTATGAVLGTPAYMAPEQLAGARSDAPADQFALCVTAWEALAGRRPFGGDTLEEIAEALHRSKPRGGEHVPHRLRAVLERGFAVDPGARWPSIDALLAALLRAARRPRRIAFAIVTGVLAIAAAAGAVALWQRREPAPAPVPWRAQIVDLPAFEENGDSAALSPDGKTIAFASDRERHEMFRIYLAPLAGGDARAITPPEESFTAARWRRDGKAVLAARWDPQTGGHDIFELPLDGSARVDLGPGTFVDDCGDALAIADDDPKVAWLALRHADGRRDVLVSTTREWVMTPRCDPSGQHIVYTRGKTATVNQPIDNLYVIDRAGHEQQITYGDTSGGGTFTPDGRSIVFSQTSGDTVSLYEVGATGGPVRRLSFESGTQVSPDVSPDGRTIAFSRDETTYVPVLGGAGPLRRLAAIRDQLSSFVVTHDGTKLVAQRVHSGKAAITVISTRDGSERTLVVGTRPFVSRDDRIVYYKPRGINALAAIPIDGGSPEVIAKLPGPLFEGLDGPDGLHLELRVGDQDEAWRLDRDRKLIPEGNGLVFPAPTGGWRAIRTIDAGFWFQLIAPDGKPARRILAQAADPTWLDDHRFAFAVANGFVVYEVTTGKQLPGTIPGPETGDAAVLANDGVHWYDLEVVGHITRYLLANFGDRPWRY